MKGFLGGTAAAAAKSLQPCPILCDPIPGILQARTLEWVAISFSNAQWLKNLPAMQEVQMWLRSLGQEDPLVEGMVTYSSILAWRILWIEEPGRLQSTWLQKVGHHWNDSTQACTDKWTST